MNTPTNDFPVCANCAADFHGEGLLCAECARTHSTVTITWRAFGEKREGVLTPAEVSHTFTIERALRKDADVLNDLFRATNLYEGADWDAAQPLPEGRSHTALSVVFGRGDYVTIDDTTYEVARFGWEQVTA